MPDNELALPLGRLATVRADPALRLVQLGTHSPDAAARAEQYAIDMLRLLDHNDEDEAARVFLDQPDRERRNRIAGVTAVLLSAGQDALLAARDNLKLPSVGLLRLTELEMAAVRIGTLPWPQRLLAVALAERGAVDGQIADVEPDQPYRDADGVHVPLQAAHGVRARTVTLPPWATDLGWNAIQTARRAGHRPCLTTEPRDRDRGRGNVHATLDRALAVAGVAASASSIRVTAAHDAHDSGGLVAAHQLLGTTKLSATQTLLKAA